jgi:acetyl-CoA carboxylase alpha subunit
MQILINVPDTLPQAIIQQQIQELEERLKKQALQPKKALSKWEKMVQRIESKNFDLGDYTETFNQDRQAFRESFNFKDKPE